MREIYFYDKTYLNTCRGFLFSAPPEHLRDSILYLAFWGRYPRGGFAASPQRADRHRRSLRI